MSVRRVGWSDRDNKEGAGLDNCSLVLARFALTMALVIWQCRRKRVAPIAG